MIKHADYTIHLHPINMKPVQPTIKVDRPNPLDSLLDLKFKLKLLSSKLPTVQKMFMHWNGSKMSLWSVSFALNYYGWLLLTSFWVHKLI